MKAALSALAVVSLAAAAQGQDPYWKAPMLQVRALYNDTDGPTKGAISRFGDSITVSKAFFAPLQYGYSNTTPESAAALSWIHAWNTSASWLWQEDAVVAQHGSWGGTTSDWPLSSAAGWPGALGGESKIAYWLRNDNPEIAIIMWGSNDLGAGLTPAQYQANMQSVVQACKANGTIPLLTTAPPRHLYDNGSASAQQRATDFYNAALAVAAAEQVPLIDYRQEILTRHPHNPPTDSWDGADGMWGGYSGYEVPTSISRDGVHPSNYSLGRSNFSEYGLDVNGYNLRNYMSLMAAYEVYNEVIVPEPAVLCLLAGGCLALLRRSEACGRMHR